MVKISRGGFWKGVRTLAWTLLTGSSWWERVVALVISGIAAAWGFIQNVPVVFIIPAALVTAAAALWLLDRIQARQFRSLTSVEDHTSPSQEKPPISRDEIATSSVISGRTIHAWDMVPVGSDSVQGKVFDDCVILGPAVVVPMGNAFSHANWGIQDPRHLREIWIEVPATPRFFYGVMFWKNCVFKDCWFDEIGLIGPKLMIEEWLGAFRSAPPQAS